MDLKKERYTKFALVREMMETPDIIKSFNPKSTERFVSTLADKKRLFLTGEGSSRIFPAKRAMVSALKNGIDLTMATEGATQSMEYDLNQFMVFGASNSGQTKEVVRLFMKLKQESHPAFYGLTANSGTKLQELALDTHILTCGKEDAVAATKSVMEQALFYDSLIRNYIKAEMTDLSSLAGMMETVLTQSIDPTLIHDLKNADLIYFAGRNNGVIEELTLKTNEITRKKSDFLEGTYAVHGIEEVMDENEIVILVDPFKDEEEKFKQCLMDGVRMKVIAISTRETIFPTIRIPNGGEYSEYIELAAGWNVLVEIGMALGINLDQPTRARKVGNEYIV
jgi:glucosamine--fructose-6-phosphate aminotransferase (isomerizing)